MSTEAPAKPSTGRAGEKPSRDEARAMAREYFEMDNLVLLKLAAAGDQNAREERLVREIMAVDGVSWDDAQPRFLEMESANKEGRFGAQLPYVVGIGVAYTAAFASIPLCFSKSTAKWFNEVFVTADVPEPADLETWLEVGSWTWGWMEPPLGQISFLILCLQFSRDRMQNIGLKPYTATIRARRAQRMVSRYPQYNARVVHQYSVGDWYDRQ